MEDWFTADQVQEFVRYFLHFIGILNEECNLLTVASLFIADTQYHGPMTGMWLKKKLRLTARLKKAYFSGIAQIKLAYIR